MVNPGLTAMRQSAGVLQNKLGDHHVRISRRNAAGRRSPGTPVVVISTVDSPFYEGAFKMDEAARKAGFAAPTIYTFDPKDYPGYTHQNTANEESAADGHTAFATFVFSG